MSQTKNSKQALIQVHTGGEDHIDIHHPNEMLQYEALYGEPLSQLWVHNKYVMVENEKMSKSLGNVYLVTGDYAETGFYSLQNPPEEVKKKFFPKKYESEKAGQVNPKTDWYFSPLAYRLMLFEHRYSEQMNFTFDKLFASQTRLFNLKKEAAKIRSLLPFFYQITADFDLEEIFKITNIQSQIKDQKLYQDFLELGLNDLNFPKLLDLFQQKLLELAKDLQSSWSQKNFKLESRLEKTLQILWWWDKKLLNLEILDLKVEAEIFDLVQKRLNAKKEKGYALADKIRVKIEKQSFMVDDYQWGSGVWKR